MSPEREGKCARVDVQINEETVHIQKDRVRFCTRSYKVCKDDMEIMHNSKEQAVHHIGGIPETYSGISTAPPLQ